ncbi:PREDICTED: Ribonuclease H domain [Prunus dulcis]|uniref:PREDICTED: Ribonuclease H domain n=1 Tax=Prunus dulcis TaxID=3755 RepID=A0A5E4F2S1_PRUDU|nr:PREDICTED: Ribonuclease H domain [Prunus dulcis]
MGFLETHLYGDPSVVPGPVWTSPPPALVKLNCDGAWVAQTGRARGGLWGFCLRDGIGCFFSAGGTRDMRCASALMVEAEAVRVALTRCLECGYDKVAVESYSLSLINMLNHEVAMDLEIEGILFDILCLTQHYHKVEFMYAPRKCNQAAHLVAAHVSRIGGRHSWDLVCVEWPFKCLAQDVNCSVRI